MSTFSISDEIQKLRSLEDEYQNGFAIVDLDVNK